LSSTFRKDGASGEGEAIQGLLRGKGPAGAGKKISKKNLNLRNA